MKTLLAAICLLAGANLLLAQATTTPPAKPAAPAVKGKAKPAEATKPEEPKIPGIVIARPDGTFLSFELVGGNFRLSFYDAKKKAMAPNVTRATARWANPQGPGDSRCVLNPNGSNALVGNKLVVGPYVFNVYLTLLQGEGEESKAVESHVVPFRY